MPFNGAGLFTRVYNWAADALAGIPMEPARFDTDAQDMATALSNCVTRNGQSPATANLPMGGYKLTGLAPGVASTDSVNFGQLSSPTSTQSINYNLGTTGAVTRSVFSNLTQTVSILDYGTGTEVGALLQAAVTAGATSIFIPYALNWTWTTPVVLPSLWRGRIFGSSGYGVQTTLITASTGHNYPCIDAQGALFVEIDGLHVLANDTGAAAPACFVVFARMPSGASSGNHRISNCTIEGPYYYCLMYNVGGEELVFQNNYWAIYGTAQAVNPRIACLVHQLSEDAFYTNIVTKAARTNGTSTSAIQHRGDVVKNQNNTGTSAVFLGPNVNDILFDLTYLTTAAASWCFYATGYYDGIRIGIDRVECDKSTPIFYAPNDSTAGSVTLFKGAYRRSGAVDSTHYAIDIAGTTASSCAIHIAPDVSFTSSFGGNTEDIYLVRSTRLTTINVDFTCGGPASSLTNSKVSIANWVAGRIVMGFSANLTVSATSYGTESFFLYDPASSKQPHVFAGGTKFTGKQTSFFGVVGSYQATDFTLDTTSSGVQAYFLNNGSVTPTIVGSITSSGSTTSFVTTSDARVKDDDGELDGATALAAVMSWKIHAYRWKVNGEADVGPFAQELRQVKPSAVTGSEDAVHVMSDGTEIMVPLGVDYSKLVPETVRAVQHQQSVIASLEQRLAALEGAKA